MESPLSFDRANFQQYWSLVFYQYSTDLREYCEDLITIIPNNSNTPFEVTLSWRNMDEYDWISLVLARDLLRGSDFWLETMSAGAKWMLRELEEALEKVEKRFSGIKFQKTLDQLSRSLFPSNLSDIDPQWFPSFQTWEGNLRRNVYKILKRVFRITFIRPRTAKRTERVRGYRDHGHESSPSERARRAANTSTWNEHLEEVYRYCLLTGASPRSALLLFNMIARE